MPLPVLRRFPGREKEKRREEREREREERQGLRDRGGETGVEEGREC